MNRTRVVITTLAVSGGLAAAWWWHATDLSRRDVLALVDRVAWSASGDPALERVTAELSRRPRAELLAAVPLLVRDVAPARRLAAGHVLAILLYDDAVVGDALHQCRAAVSALLDDDDVSVRAAALSVVSWHWMKEPALVVPPGTRDCVRALLASPEIAVRWSAVFAAYLFGNRVAHIPTLVAALGRESDAGLRMLLAMALRWSGPGDEDAVAALVRCLADPDAKVRSAAAGSLGELGPLARGAVPALRELLARAGEPADSRCAAVAALGRLVVAPADAEAVLPTALALRDAYGPWPLGWVQDVGRLACRVPTHGLADTADAALAAAAEDVLLEGVVAGWRLRLAAARGETKFRTACVESLRQALADAAAGITEGIASVPGSQELVDVCIELLPYPAAGVDRAVVTSMLAHMGEHGSVWESDWALRQQARLR